MSDLPAPSSSNEEPSTVMTSVSGGVDLDAEHITSGEARYFRDRETLIVRLHDMLTTDEV